jgi:hypothetical protein
LAFTKHPPAANQATGQPTRPDGVVNVLAANVDPSGPAFLQKLCS